MREIAAKQIIKRYGVFISADTNGYNPKEKRNNPNMHAFLEIIRFEKNDITGRHNKVNIEAGNIMNPASIGDRFCITCANMGTAYIAPKFPILVQNVIIIPQK